jgi:serine/threonine protein phosphatase PrpC
LEGLSAVNDDQRLKDTEEFFRPLAGGASTGWPVGSSTKVEIDMAAATDKGLARESNQDHFLTAQAGRWLEAMQTSVEEGVIPKRAEEVVYGLLVADGMGGTLGGELASRTALSTLISLVLHTPDWIFGEGDAEVQRIMHRFADRFRKIQKTLGDMGRKDPELAEMGTTMTVACSCGSVCVVGHIGDSRAYLLRAGKLVQLTRDHTYVQVMIDSGLMTAEQAADHPWRHILSRALGGGGQETEGDFNRLDLVDGDQLLLCSDGLSNMVLDGDIAETLLRTPTAADACQELIKQALDNGGFDNVTVALARYKLPK